MFEFRFSYASVAPALLAMLGTACSATDAEVEDSSAGGSALISHTKPDGAPRTVQVTSEIAAWNADIRTAASAPGVNAATYTECAAVQELPDLFLCASMTQQHMNEGLTRASLFVEGLLGNAKGEIASTNGGAYRQGLRLIGGHDLKSKDLKEFWTALNAKCEATGDASFCPTAAETEIFAFIDRPDAPESFVLITYALQSNMSYMQVVGHEILHAQYFLDETYRQTTDDFWADAVTDADKQSAVGMLGRYYNASDELLMKNEFQAYVLMPGAAQNLLGGLSSTYREPLRTALAEGGISPIQVDGCTDAARECTPGATRSCETGKAQACNPSCGWDPCLPTAND